MVRILLVDDDIESRTAVGDFLREMGHEVVECENGEEALSIYFNQKDFPMVLSDIKMPRLSGIELLRSIKASTSEYETHFVLFTGHGDMNTAIDALKAGAYDYLLKPINIEELVLVTERIEEHKKLIEENKKLRIDTEEAEKQIKRLKQSVAKTSGIHKYGFFSDKMEKIFQLAQKYHTDRSIPVFIQGETGTGKEVIARLIHNGISVNEAPFIDINCAAITPSLFESELFGYEGGAFTGGLNKGQKGKFDLAQGGTLFLDEIAEIPLELQGKLLRVIQEKEFYRVGGLKKLNTNVRIICATNVNIEKKVQEGKFREDLYYRLKVGNIIIPPLRERNEEIIPLAHMFLLRFAKEKGKKFTDFSEGAIKLLNEYPWPGNIRELQNAIEWAVFMYNDTKLGSIHLDLINKKEVLSKERALLLNPEDFVLPQEGFELDEFVNKIIIKALNEHNTNKTETARYLGISRRSLYSRLENISHDKSTT